MTGARRVAILAGGLSFERQASLLSGANVQRALASAGIDSTIVDADAHIVERLQHVDVALLAMHGRLGEDGTIQSLLDLMGLPYSGPGAATTALTWNKPLAKEVLSRAGVATPPSVTFSSDAFRELGAAAVFKGIQDLFDYPVVVKPSAGGSAFGVTRVAEPGGLAEALMHAFSFNDSVLVERFVEGTEVGVTVWRGEPLPPVEIEPTSGPYDYTARYTPDGATFYAPARLPAATLEACAAAAMQAWDTLGCRDIARADLVVDADGTPWLLEMTTSPGLTSTSLVPQALDAAGIGFAQALADLVEDVAGR